MPTLLRIREVSQKTGLGKTTIYRYIRSGDFPPPIQLGPRAVAWDQEIVDAWINERIARAQHGGEVA